MAILWKKNSLKQLSLNFKNKAGHNNTGRITSYHRGGFCKQHVRLIDFNRYLWNIFGLITRLEYDPKRNALIALVIYSNGVICYTLNAEANKVGDKIITRKNNFLITGNSTYLYEIPVGTHIHNLEFFEGLGAQIARSAGNYAVIISKSIKNCVVRLKSHQLKILPSRSIGTIGNVSNFRFLYKNFKKAGYYRRKGWRPHVRGVAMNPIDHPHGGGQGKTSGGRPSVTPYGKITKGQPTVKIKKFN
jgi:large subunit ribosomal protein L2